MDLDSRADDHCVRAVRRLADETICVREKLSGINMPQINFAAPCALKAWICLRYDPGRNQTEVV
jgi:hypothetical protein